MPEQSDPDERHNGSGKAQAADRIVEVRPDSAAVITTSRTARTLCRVAVAIRVAQEAPASRLTAIGQWGARSV